MTKKRLKLIILAIIAVLPSGTRAQIVNCNGFLKGQYIEAGINWNGCFGSSTRPPAGFHPERRSALYNSPACGGAIANDSAIGFVSDPSADGWDVGSPARFGDYILPGVTQEGWSYFADGSQIDAWNYLAASTDSLTDGMTSSVLSYIDTLGVRQIKTQAVKNGVYVTHIYSLDTTKLFIGVEVLIDNTSLSTVNDVMYMRTLNPHNDQSLSSSPATKNKIDYALPDTLFRTVVSARGTTYSDAYLALATQDTRAKAFIYKNAGLPAITIDNINAGDANYLYNKNDSTVNNTSIGIIYDLGNLNSGGLAHFNFIYAFKSSVIDSTLNTIDTHLVVKNVIPQNFKVYPNPVSNAFKVAGLQHGDALEVFDMTGRSVAYFDATAANSFKLDAVATGYYILAIRDKQGFIKGRVALQKE